MSIFTHFLAFATGSFCGMFLLLLVQGASMLDKTYEKE